MLLRIFHLVLLLAIVAVVGACRSASHTRSDQRSSGTTARAGTSSPNRSSISGPSYRVARGDTVYGIAFRNGVDFRDLARWNNISAPFTIYVGQVLRLGPAGGAVASTSPSTKNIRPSQSPSQSPTSAPPPKLPAPSGPAAAASAGSVTSAPPPSAQHPPLANTGPVSFRWPLEGPLLARYVSGDPARAGIDIGGKAGTQVRASADGEVVYSGNGLVLYGELIIIKHTNSLLSAYARNGRRLVEEGSRVKAGQAIAEIGSSRQQLHFEIRRDGKPVNPLDFLPKR